MTVIIICEIGAVLNILLLFFKKKRCKASITATKKEIIKVYCNGVKSENAVVYNQVYKYTVNDKEYTYIYGRELDSDSDVRLPDIELLYNPNKPEEVIEETDYKIELAIAHIIVFSMTITLILMQLMISGVI